MTHFRKPDPAPRKRRKPIPRVSVKRAAVNVLRAEFVREQLARRPYCEAGPLIGAVLGETFMRGGGNRRAGWPPWPSRQPSCR